MAGKRSAELEPLLLTEQRESYNGENNAEQSNDNSGCFTESDSADESSSYKTLNYRPNGMSNAVTIMQVIKGSTGAGTLAMPYALSQAGIAVGMVGMVLLSTVCIHCMHLLLKCSHHLRFKTKTSSLGYNCVAEEAFKFCSPGLSKLSSKARTLVELFLVISQFGDCCIYILFVAQNVQFVVMKLMNNIGEDCDPNNPMPLRLYELCLVVLLILLVYIRDIKHLAPLSIVANMATAIGLTVILYDILIKEGLKDVNRLPLFKGWRSLPLFLGTTTFSFHGITALLPIEEKMKDPSSLKPPCGVLNVSMVIVCALYMTVGFYGYIQYGNHSAGSISLNLTSWYAIAVQLLYAAAIFVSYGIQFLVLMAAVGEEWMTGNRCAQLIGSTAFNYLFRAALVLLTYLVTALVDRYLNLLISLIGSIAGSGLVFIFPALLEIVTFWPNRAQIKGYWVIVAKDCLIIGLGIVVGISGVIVGINELLAQLSFHNLSGGCPPKPF